ncbi:PHP C-terminal domain protein [Olavius algarvensis Delta 1 endosymbiont]|nr:PHP C-terminal domain protein [Olavius algarvensis Delta 1 endosymbiont]
MKTFSRSQIIGAEFPNEQTVRLKGLQVDHIYSMEINMDVRISDGEILAIEGLMKRYTNFVCPQALPVLQSAVGMSLREAGWDRRIMKEIGRQGCEHFAEIIIECGRSLDQACLSKDLWRALEADPSLDQAEFMEQWIGLQPANEPK